ncbi:MAG: L-serine ammonia-lyase, iron-sulfur-dependent subunit beta [Eubacteriales bacterium]|nr:L-serine ammonia-lyase, iron-sulfur-dependent subunit beta [Eubacteriales bacterium]
MNIFDVLGPVMIGPSSSHTAGAVKIARTAAKMLDDKPIKADIGLYGSFAMTGKGHGTDVALIAGLLGMKTDDERIPDSFEIAEKAGLDFNIHEVSLKNAHPNSVVLDLKGEHGRTLNIVGESIGGGRINIRSIDGITVNFSGDMDTLIVHDKDKPGSASAITTALTQRNINIATIQLYRDIKGGKAVMVCECDEPVPDDIRTWLMSIDQILKVTIFNREDD